MEQRNSYGGDVENRNHEVVYDPRLGYIGNLKEVAEIVNSEDLCVGQTLTVVIYESKYETTRPEKDDLEFKPQIKGANRFRGDLASLIHRGWVPSVWVRINPNDRYNCRKTHRYQLCLDIRKH
jgi:hypothetical protein